MVLSGYGNLTVLSSMAQYNMYTHHILSHLLTNIFAFSTIFVTDSGCDKTCSTVLSFTRVAKEQRGRYLVTTLLYMQYNEVDNHQ